MELIELFNRLSEANLEDFQDKELIELHRKASDLFESATVNEYDDNGYEARVDANAAEYYMDAFEEVRDWKT